MDGWAVLGRKATFGEAEFTLIWDYTTAPTFPRITLDKIIANTLLFTMHTVSGTLYTVTVHMMMAIRWQLCSCGHQKLCLSQIIPDSFAWNWENWVKFSITEANSPEIFKHSFFSIEGLVSQCSLVFKAGTAKQNFTLLKLRMELKTNFSLLLSIFWGFFVVTKLPLP